jgi:hypothetical protein
MMHFVYGCTEVIALIFDGRIIVFHLLIFVTMEDASMMHFVYGRTEIVGGRMIVTPLPYVVGSLVLKSNS